MMNGRSGDRRADQAAFVAGGEGVGGVFDDGKAMPGGDGGDGVQLGRQTGDVHGDDGPGAWGDGGLDAGGIEIQIAAIYIHQDGPGVEVADDLGRGREGVGRGDDLVARANAGLDEDQVQRGRAGGERQRIRRADRGGELGLERVHLRAERRDRVGGEGLLDT